MDSLAFLERADKAKRQPLYVLHGDEHFLKRQVRSALRKLVLGPNDDGFALSVLTGDTATWAVILEDLETLPFLSPARLVVVESADSFVTRERPRLEKFVSGLKERTSTTGVLVLEVGTWPATTKLAKMVPDASSIACKTPAAADLSAWCVKWCSAQHGKGLAVAAARLLINLIGPEMGLLDQELAKLAVYIGSAPRIEAHDVDQLVGNSREENTFKIFDLIGAGKVGEALVFLNRLLDQGEEPIQLLGAFRWQLSRLAQTGRLCLQGVGVTEAFERVGVAQLQRSAAEQQMRHFGRRRLDQLYDWLVQTDQGLKGGSQLPMRTVLERFVVQLARPRS